MNMVRASALLAALIAVLPTHANDNSNTLVQTTLQRAQRLITLLQDQKEHKAPRENAPAPNDPAYPVPAPGDLQEQLDELHECVCALNKGGEIADLDTIVCIVEAIEKQVCSCV